MNKKTHKTINPDKPVIPVVISFPPEIPIIEIATVAFIVPCKIAAAITDFAFMVIYRWNGVSRIHHTTIIKTPICGC